MTDDPGPTERAEAPAASDDRMLVLAVLAGDELARARLATRLRYAARVLAARNRRLGRPFQDTEIEDLVQDTIVKIWEHLPRFQGKSALESWMYSVCVRTLSNALRERRARQRWLPAAEGVDPERLIEQQTALAHEVEDFTRSLDQLEPERARTIRMRHENDASFGEIGERLGVPAATAKTWYYRGLARLRELIALRRAGRAT